MKRIFSFLGGLCFILALNIAWRLFPAYFPQLKSQARANIEQRHWQEAAFWAEKSFPALSLPAKAALAGRRLAEFKRVNKGRIKNELQQEYLRLKAPYQDKQGCTYLMEVDCWHWARYTENVLLHQHPGDLFKNGLAFDSLMVYPFGSYLPWNHFLFYFSASLYRLSCFFFKVSLYHFLFYLPLFFTALFLIALYSFCFLYLGNIAAVLATLFIGMAPVFLQHSSAGWFDMDVLNLFFAFLAVLSYLYAFQAQGLIRRVFYLLTASFWLGIFFYTWPYAWFVLLVIFIYEGYQLCGLIFEPSPGSHKAFIFRRLSGLLLFFGFSCFWVGLLCGKAPFLAFYGQLEHCLGLGRPVLGGLWPNSLSTVAELRKVNFETITAAAGGVLLTVISWICLAVIFLFNRRYQALKREVIIIMAVWFLCMLFASYRGVRFVIYLLLPLGISLGWAISEFYHYCLRRKSLLWMLFGLITSGVLAFTAIANGYETARGIYPMMNSSWYSALTTLREKTPLEAVVNSWWDFGDWFKAVAKRRVIIDGQSQHLPQAYWMARVLLSDNEGEAVNILRMLNNAGNQPYALLAGHFSDSLTAVLLLDRLLSASYSAKDAELNLLPRQLSAELRQALFSIPARSYLVVDYSLPNKILQISYIGRWDFAKVYLWQNLAKGKDSALSGLIKSGLDKKEAEEIFLEASGLNSQELAEWVSQRQRFYSRLLYGEVREDKVFFNAGVIYSPKEKDACLYSCRDAVFKRPKKLFIFDGAVFEERAYRASELDFSLLVFRTEEGAYRALLLDEGLAKSIFVRLYFLNGRGLKYFRPFSEERLPGSDSYIRIFEVLWEKAATEK